MLISLAVFFQLSNCFDLITWLCYMASLAQLENEGNEMSKARKNSKVHQNLVPWRTRSLGLHWSAAFLRLTSTSQVSGYNNSIFQNNIHVFLKETFWETSYVIRTSGRRFFVPMTALSIISGSWNQWCCCLTIPERGRLHSSSHNHHHFMRQFHIRLKTKVSSRGRLKHEPKICYDGKQ